MTFYIDGMMCAHCSKTFEEKGAKLPGVRKIHLNYGAGKVKVEIDPTFDQTMVVGSLKDLCVAIEPKARLVEAEKRSKENRTGNIVINSWKEYAKEWLKIGLAGLLMVAGIFYPKEDAVNLGLFLVAYLILAKDVLLTAFSNIKKGEVFDENFLMSIATIGAFAIGEYPEGVAVMLFYSLGELFQDMAVSKSRASIKDLMDIRPDFANWITLTGVEKIAPDKVPVGQTILVKPGEKVPLDGIILKGEAQFDTSSLTGESVPRKIKVGDSVLSGFINKNAPVEIKVEKSFQESTASKILDLVENAAEKKAKTERFITKFAKYYTPAVVVVAAVLAFAPPLVMGGDVKDWIYRALVFLVVSCPCALVISIPLGFFGGIGAASHHGILVKGGNYLEALKNAEIVVFDKTGTLTEGDFSVHEVQPIDGIEQEELLELAAYAEYFSNHPIALSIRKKYTGEVKKEHIGHYEEIQGRGVRVEYQGQTILAGNEKLMAESGILGTVAKQGTMVYLAVDGKYVGSLSIYDQIKEDAKEGVARLKQLGLKKTVLLTGDNETTATLVAKKVGIDEYHSNLLPSDKVEQLEKIMETASEKGQVVFTGDGINDAPVLARADVGIAMGGLGSDAAIEAADVVIMTDEPSKISKAIAISKKTMRVIWQNIVFTFGVKAVVLTMGAFGIATMWEAVFADVGVALIAVINASRIRRL